MSSRPVLVTAQNYALERKPVRMSSRQNPALIRPARYRLCQADDKLNLAHSGGHHPGPPKYGRRIPRAWKLREQMDSSAENSSDNVHPISAKKRTPEVYVLSVANEENLEMQEVIEKCMKWVQGLPEKFSGLNDLLPPINYDMVESGEN